MASQEKAYKGFAHFFSQSINTLASLIKVWLRSKKPFILPPPSGTDCIVLGNGPSLKTTLALHHSYLRGKPIMCVNLFALSEEYIKLQPRYYVMLDPGMWYEGSTEITQCIHAITEKTSWPLYVFVPPAALHSPLLARWKENSFIHVVRMNYVVFKGFERIKFYYFRKNRAMPQSQNVLVASLFLAINLQYKKIEVFGADHSWHEQLSVNENNVVCMKHYHFFGAQEEVKLVPFAKGRHLSETFRMDEILHAWAKVFAGHFVIEKYSRHRGARVFNASAISYIDAYERSRIP